MDNISNYFDDYYVDSSENEYVIEEGPEIDPEGGLVLEVLDYRGQTDEVITGIVAIREYIDKHYPVKCD